MHASPDERAEGFGRDPVGLEKEVDVGGDQVDQVFLQAGNDALGSGVA